MGLCEYDDEPCGSVKGKKFEYVSNYCFLQRGFTPCNECVNGGNLLMSTGIRYIIRTEQLSFLSSDQNNIIQC